MFTTLISPEALVAHLDDSSWVIVDCRHSLADFDAGRRAYEAAHIPNAAFARVESDLSGEKTGSNGRHPLPHADTFAMFLRGIGVNEATQIVAYDAGADMFAARLWFLSRWIGHDNVAVLDGGFAAWSAAGLPRTTATRPPRAAGNIVARPRHDLVVDAAYVLQHLNDADTVIVDARGTDRFRGINETVDPIGGHLPGAHNRHYALNFQDGGRFKLPATLAQEFASLGNSQRIVHQCGSGVSATVNLLAMEHAGLTGSRVYPGSWSEWISDPSRPTATEDIS